MPVEIMKNKNVLLDHAAEGETEKDLVVLIVSDTTNKKFDIKVHQKKNKEYVLNYLIII